MKTLTDPSLTVGDLKKIPIPGDIEAAVMLLAQAIEAGRISSGSVSCLISLRGDAFNHLRCIQRNETR